ncbi:aldo/keto reductase family protein [Hokovirus HKV1]|uniref:Aldo/keto reductase family protein n=1 Tax=Hokovirus HKV1 TaxID=1977638 RepID=A0A1V0SEI7_9VIRU|nr:aldo/keto reductase family protein [Hokovirus HKV1]
MNITYHKYKKYKNKYINLKHCMHGGNKYILGFGTDLISEKYLPKQKCIELLELAIKNGYKIIDSANMYNNKDLITEALNNLISQNIIKRQDIKIIYKSFLPDIVDSLSDNIITDNNEYEDYINDLNDTINKFGYIDYYMFHSVPYQDNKNINVCMTYIRNLMNKKLILEFGVSNTSNELPCNMIDTLGNISVIENKFNHTMINNNNLKYYNDCINSNVKVIVYGALGGKQTGACGSKYIYTSPYPILDKLTHPNITSIAETYNLDKHMLILAYETVKYNFMHIPSSSNPNRIIDNILYYNKSIELLINNNDLLNKIDQDFNYDDRNKITTIANYFSNANDIFNVIGSYKGRLNLLYNLCFQDSPICKFIINFLPKIQGIDKIIFLNGFIFSCEVALKKNKFIDFENAINLLKQEYINEYLNIMKITFLNENVYEGTINYDSETYYDPDTYIINEINNFINYISMSSLLIQKNIRFNFNISMLYIDDLIGYKYNYLCYFKNTNLKICKIAVHKTTNVSDIIESYLSKINFVNISNIIISEIPIVLNNQKSTLFALTDINSDENLNYLNNNLNNITKYIENTNFKDLTYYKHDETTWHLYVYLPKENTIITMYIKPPYMYKKIPIRGNVTRYINVNNILNYFKEFSSFKNKKNKIYSINNNNFTYINDDYTKHNLDYHEIIIIDNYDSDNFINNIKENINNIHKYIDESYKYANPVYKFHNFIIS